MDDAQAPGGQDNGLQMGALDAAIARVRNALADRPFVVGQLGQSLDGRIATATGESQWINGERALDHVHRLRAAVDAVVVGAGTIAADNPRLNVRRCQGDSPARVVIDPRGRIDGTGAWLADDGARRVVVTDQEAHLARDAACRRNGVEVVALARDPIGTLRPVDIAAALFDLGLRRLLIEGGARTVSHFIDAGAMDRLHVLVAPMLIGSGPRGLQLAEIAKLADAKRLRADIIPLADGDVLFDCDLRRADLTQG